MNAQRSVWSPPPTVPQKYAAYFGGIIDEEQPLIRLWWTDEEMKRFAYRELEMPDGLLALSNSIINRFPLYPYLARPHLRSVTHDNVVLFLDVLLLPDTVSAIYVVCDPERVLHYGLIPLVSRPAGDPEREGERVPALITYGTGGAWTWDGTNAWPFFGGVREEDTNDVFTCKINTQTGVAGPATKVFDGYFIDPWGPELSFESYFASDVAWVATNPQEPRAMLASIHLIRQYPHGYGFLSDYTIEIKYLPDGPTISTISRSGLTTPARPSTRIHGTFPEGPTAIIGYIPARREADSVTYVVYQDRVALAIPVIWMLGPPIYKTTDTGLPYDLEVAGGVRLLRVSGNRAILFFGSTRIVGGASGYKDVLVEYDLDSGIAVRDIVVPTINPKWGMEHNGTTLAAPMMTSSRGRINLPK